MDTRSKTLRSGLLRSFGIAGVAFSLLFGIADPSIAESPMIQAGGKSQSLVVLDTTQPGVFPEQSWHLVAPNPIGPTIVIWTIQPFQNVTNHKDQVDAGMFLTIHNQGQSSRNWQVIIPQGRTSFRSGQSAGHVVAGSQGGTGEAGVTVYFLCHEQTQIADGNYETTVVGTITEAF